VVDLWAARFTASSSTGGKPASVGGVYPPLAVAPLAPCRIDSAAGLRGLLYRPESGALAYRAFVLNPLRGQLWHVIPSKGLPVTRPEVSKSAAPSATNLRL
jgi:hypothetical protein